MSTSNDLQTQLVEQQNQPLLSEQEKDDDLVSIEGKDETSKEWLASSCEEESPEISKLASEVKTHFSVVIKRNKRGLARYKCRRCNHEFECCGRIRLIHHVIGVMPDGTKVRHVKSCTNPYLPLRESLLKYVTDTPQISYPRIQQKNKNKPNLETISLFRTLLEQLQQQQLHFQQQSHSFSSVRKSEELRFPPSSHSGSESFPSDTAQPLQSSASFLPVSAGNGVLDHLPFNSSIRSAENDFMNYSRERLLSLLLILQQYAPQSLQFAMEIERVRGPILDVKNQVDLFPLFTPSTFSPILALSLGGQTSNLLLNSNPINHPTYIPNHHLQQQQRQQQQQQQQQQIPELYNLNSTSSEASSHPISVHQQLLPIPALLVEELLTILNTSSNNNDWIS